MNQSSDNNRLSQDQYEQILTWLEASVPTIWNFVHAFPRLFAFEELYQDTFLFLASMHGKIASKRNPIAYARASVRMYIIRSRAIVREQSMLTMSLDTPITEDGLTLGDLLAADHPEERDELAEDQRIQAVHEALRRLPLEDQKYLRRVYKLNSFDPVPLYPYSLNNRNSKDVIISQHAFRALRRDTLLSDQLFS